MRPIEWCHRQWPWMTLPRVQGIEVTPFLTSNISETVRDSHNIVIGTYTCPIQRRRFEWPWVTLSDFAKYSMTRSTEASRACTWVFQKVAPPPKTFWNIFTSVKSFCVKVCKFVGNLYQRISTNFCRFSLIFHQMALFFPEYPSFSICQVFEYSPRQWNCRDVICLTSHVLVSDYCKQSITVSVCLIFY